MSAKLKSVVMGLLAVFAMAGAVRGQTLAEVLCSVQERKLVVVQRAQVEARLNNKADPGQQLIVWEGLPGAAFPEAAQVDALGTGQRVALLSQAMTEFSGLAPSYLNLRSGDLAGGAKVGALRPFIQEDFPQLPRVEAGNFPVVLAAFARQVRELRVLPWVASLRVRTNSYFKRRWEVMDGNVVTEAAGSDPIGWQPATLGVGDPDDDAPGWFTASVGTGPGMESLVASGVHTVTTHHDGPPDGESDYDLRNTTCSQTTRFISDAHMMVVPPGAAQAVTGRVALVAHVEYNSVAASSFDPLPGQWDPGDAGFHVLAVSAPGGGDIELSANGPGIKAKLEWSALTTTAADAKSSYGEVDSTLPAGSLGSVTGLRRALYPLLVPAFARGLDTAGSGVPGALDQAAKAIRPPSGDGQVVLHPRPGLLVGVPLGVGLSGDNSTGWIGISPGYYDFMTPLFQPMDFFAYGVISPAYNSYGGYALSPIGIRFDHSANLRFVGAAEDFHVVYATARGTGGRGAAFPGGYPTPAELAGSGWEPQSVLTAWDLPRIRQIVGRDLIADVSTQGHYRTTVTIYRRPADAGEVDRTPGQPVPVAALSPIRTLVFENPSNTGDALYFGGFEKVKVTDGSHSYSVVRDSLAAHTGTVTFTGPNHQETILLTNDAQTGGRGAEVGLAENGASLGTSVITGDSQWKWWGYRLPVKVVRTAAGETRTDLVTIDSSAGCRGGHFARSLSSSGGTGPAASLSWDGNGLPLTASYGQWSETTEPEGTGSLKVTHKLGGAVWATTWTELLDGGSRIRTYSAPDGGSHSKNGGSVDWVETGFGSGTAGLPGLPHIIRDKSGGGATFAWTVNADGSGRLVTGSGKLSGDSVTDGTSTTREFNARGYTTESTATDIAGNLEIAGLTGTGFTGWGAPVAAGDHMTGLSTSWTYDGNRSRVSSLTTPLGLTTDYSGFDALGRAGTIAWNGISASRVFTGLGVGTTFTEAGVQIGTQSTTLDALGRLTASGTTWNGESYSLDLTYGTGTVGVSRGVGPYGIHNSSVRRGDGSVASASGPTLAFGGSTGAALSVSDGLLVSRSAVAGQQGDFQETHADAWGRVRRIVTPPAQGTGPVETSFGYSAPGTTLRRVIVTGPSGRVLITESDPYASNGSVSRSGIDVNQNGGLGATDRYAESVTTVTSGKVATTLWITENNGLREILRAEWKPGTGVTVTTINGGEETITATPDYAARSVTTSSTKGWSVTETVNNLGLSTGGNLSGTGIPASGLAPVWRADGSLASVELTIGGETHTAAFNPNGTLSSLTAPGRGNILGGHTIGGGTESLTVDGVTVERKLDGTRGGVSGVDITGGTDTLAVSGGGYRKTTSPATGADTITTYGASGAPTGKTYAAGAGESYGYTDELLTSVSLARGGSLALGYSNDGAKDLVSAVWPATASGPLAIPPVALGFGYDRAGRVDGITDPSGSRSLGYSNGRLTGATYNSGPLGGYEIIRNRDTSGRDTGFTLKRDGAVIHSASKAPNGVSDQISALASGSLKVVPRRDGAGRVTGFQWGNATGTFVPAVSQTWQRGTGGRIESAGSDVPGAPSFTYLTDPGDPGRSFDARNRRLRCATAGGTWSYTYGLNGQLTSAVHPALGAFTYQFDGIGRRTDKGTANTTDLLNRTLAWTNSQSRTLTVRAAQGARVWINGAEVQGFDGSASYTVPPPGEDGGWVEWNVLAVLEGQGEGAGNPPADVHASPDAKARQTGAVWVPPVSESLSYDAAGNRGSSAQWDYGWNGRNELVRARTKDHGTAARGFDLTFGYDAEGRRYRKHVIEYRNGVPVSEEEITYIWDGWDLIYERHQHPGGLTTLERRYLWGPDIANGEAGGAGGLLLIRETRGATTTDLIPLYDGTGHVTALANANRDLLATYAYGPFGEQIHATGPAAQANPWRYATKYLDAETGLYYFGCRYYDPVTGQWMSRELLGESESLNLYSYCHNDPVNRVDVLGLKESSVINADDPFVLVNGVWHRNEVILHQADWFLQKSKGILPGSGHIGRAAGPLDFAGWVLEGGKWTRTAGNSLMVEASRIAEENYHLSTHANIGKTAMGIYGVALAAPGIVLAAPEVAGAAAEGYFVAGVRGSMMLESAAPVLSRLAATGTAAFLYGAAHDPETAAMALSSPTAMDDIGAGLSGFRYLAQDARFAANSAAPFFRASNWEFAPLGQLNMGVPLPRYVGGNNNYQWFIGPHGRMPSPRPLGMQSHHGVNSVWMEANVAGYQAGSAPAMFMTNSPSHNATRGLFNRFRVEIAARQGVSPRNINWAEVQPGTAWRLAEEQFSAAGVPLEARAEYFRQLQEYLISIGY